MEIAVKTEDKDGNIIFEGILKRKELDFVVNVGMGYLLSQGAASFIHEADEGTTVFTEGPETQQ